MRRIFRVVLVLAIGLWSLTAQAQPRITVFAAASLKDALEEAARVYETDTGVKVVLSLAASSVLARQIEAGAPADAIVSADLEWVDWLAQRRLIVPETRRNLIGNRLVIAAPGSASSVSEPSLLLEAGRFAMGDPEHVPAGKYAQAALEKLGLWERVRRNAVFTENVRVALEFVRRGELGAAIVYGSDRSAAPHLVEAYSFPADSHPPIVYPAAVTAEGNQAAVGFLDYLSGKEGQAIFARFGFAPLDT